MAFALSLSFICFLVVYEAALKDRLTRAMRGFFFPIQLFVVVVGTMLSHFLDLPGKHQIAVVGSVATG